MSWQPPRTQPQYVPSVAGLWGTIVRCDYPLAGAIDGHLQISRDSLNAWSLSTAKNTLVEIPGSAVQHVRVHDATIREKYTPGWAIAVGVVGLLVFLLGIFFFFVKSERDVPAAIIEVVGTDGRVLAFRVVNQQPTQLRVGIGAS